VLYRTKDNTQHNVEHIMSRPKRKAAQDAVSKIQVQDVYHWENLSESSQEFQKCAEQIEKEFANEGSKKRS